MIPTLNHPLGMPYARRIQYLASTGTQYIDTGVKPDYAGGDTVSIRFMAATVPGTSAYQVFGSRDTATRNGFNFFVDGRVVPHIRYVSCDNAGYTIGGYNSVPFSYGDILTVDVNDSTVSLAGPDYSDTQSVYRSVTSDYPVYLFCLSLAGTAMDNYPGMRLYDWKYYRNGTLAQHLIPVLDKSGVPCLYDTVTHTLKYNARTGTFDYA